MTSVDHTSVDISYTTAPWKCAPCHTSRVQASPTPLIILLLVAVNYIPMVFFSLSMGVDSGRVFAVVIFHMSLVLMVLSWSYTCCTDPGTAPQWWQRQMAQEVANGRDVTVCRRSGLYKPPRSHFDSVTERLTLNMDHFCPWVVNTVGFYNRKFFLLFLIYANLTMLISLVSLVIMISAGGMWQWAQSESANGGVTLFFPGFINTIVIIVAVGIDACMLFCVLGPFMLFHLGMAMRNETTIEGRTNPCYDIGRLRNLRSVFGRKTWTWPLPLYLNGPDGDGLVWPRLHDVPATGLRDEFGGSRTSNAVACGSGASSSGASHSAAKTVPSESIAAADKNAARPAAKGGGAAASLPPSPPNSASPTPQVEDLEAQSLERVP